MWLLKLHFSVSILCLLMIVGFVKVFKQSIKDNGWYDNQTDGKKNVFAKLACFVPILNIMMCIMTLIMISIKKEDFYKMCEEEKKNNEG